MDNSNEWIPGTARSLRREGGSLAEVQREKQGGQLTAEQLDAIRHFASAYGRKWKAELNAMWQDGRDARQPHGHLLRQVRNTFGPAWLTKFKLD